MRSDLDEEWEPIYLVDQTNYVPPLWYLFGRWFFWVVGLAIGVAILFIWLKVILIFLAIAIPVALSAVAYSLWRGGW